MINFRCGSCGRPLEAHDSTAGRSIACPQCGREQVVPWATTAQPAVQQQPPAQPVEPAKPEQVEPAGQQPQATPPASPPAFVDPNQNLWRVGTHLSALLGYVAGLGPLGWVGGPLVIWLIRRQQDSWVDEQGKEALNFNISVTIYSVVAGLLIFALIGFILLPAVIIFHVVMVIIAAVRASNGQTYRYPLTIRFVK